MMRLHDDTSVVGEEGGWIGAVLPGLTRQNGQDAVTQQRYGQELLPRADRSSQRREAGQGPASWKLPPPVAACSARTHL